ncbi:MAG: phosphoribosyl-AMP cyclohydrolase [Parvularculaceae bacterium]|nr:phosphoribosyl-AMP cyclohydrolase [Parvularculaceae bacterium]
MAGDNEIDETLEFRPKYNADGLIAAAATDAASGRLLMIAWMNDEALRLTLETGIAHYWSRSRAKLWRKGETSGHVQNVREIRIDCDQDAVELVVEQTGSACHTGRRSCFYRTVTQRDGAVTLAFT